MLDDLPTLLLFVPMVLLALTVHECAHAWTAWLFGDSTAADQGRISLNPLVHLDPWGALALLICGFGWAKPVPYDRGNLQAAHPRWVRWTELGVAAAGPLSNLLLAGVLRLVLELGPWLPVESQFVFHRMIVWGVVINIGLFLFNLIPVFPLDGFTVLRNALPLDAARAFQKTQAYGSYLLLGYILLGQTMEFSLVGPAQKFLLEHLYRLRLA